MRIPALSSRLAAEALGTFWLVFGGCGSAIFAAKFLTPNVVAGQTYTYFVRAKNSSGSKDSNTISVFIPGNICTLAAPTISSISPDSGSSSSDGIA